MKIAGNSDHLQNILSTAIRDDQTIAQTHCDLSKIIMPGSVLYQQRIIRDHTEQSDYLLTAATNIKETSVLFLPRKALVKSLKTLHEKAVLV